MTLLVSKILMDLTDLIVKPSVDFRLCISKASLHQGCQLCPSQAIPGVGTHLHTPGHHGWLRHPTPSHHRGLEHPTPSHHLLKIDVLPPSSFAINDILFFHKRKNFLWTNGKHFHRNCSPCSSLCTGCILSNIDLVFLDHGVDWCWTGSLFLNWIWIRSSICQLKLDWFPKT